MMTAPKIKITIAVLAILAFTALIPAALYLRMDTDTLLLILLAANVLLLIIRRTISRRTP